MTLQEIDDELPEPAVVPKVGMRLPEVDPGLHRRVSAALHHEAWLLDDARFEEWLEWISPDVRYWMPTRFVRKATERELEFSTLDRGVCFLDEDYEALAMRVRKMRHRMSWTDNPGARTTHAVTNIEIESACPEQTVVRSVVSVHRSRFAHASDVWIVRRRDTIDTSGEALFLLDREVYYDSPVLESSNLAIFF